MIKKGDYQMYIFIISDLVAMLLLTIFIRIKYNIVADFGLYRHINNAHKWVERILLLLFIIIMVVTVFEFALSQENIYVFIFGFFTLLSSFRTFMEYKYEREEKKYIIELIWAIGNFIIFIGLIFFNL